MGKTIRYDYENAKCMPRLFVIEFFNEKSGIWMQTKGIRRRAKAESILNDYRVDGVMARMTVR